jgi:cytochrome b561
MRQDQNAMKTGQSGSIEAYSNTAIVLHWVLAVSILTVFVVGLRIQAMPFSPAKLQVINWHKWAGVTILALSAVRLAWRLTHRPPALPARIEQGMPGWQRVAYHGVHQLMYVLFFAVPLLGWAYSSAKGFPIVWVRRAAATGSGGQGRGPGRHAQAFAWAGGLCSDRPGRAAYRGGAEAPVHRPGRPAGADATWAPLKRSSFWKH